LIKKFKIAQYRDIEEENYRRFLGKLYKEYLLHVITA